MEFSKFKDILTELGYSTETWTPMSKVRSMGLIAGPQLYMNPIDRIVYVDETNEAVYVRDGYLTAYGTKFAAEPTISGATFTVPSIDHKFIVDMIELGTRMISKVNPPKVGDTITAIVSGVRSDIGIVTAIVFNNDNTVTFTLDSSIPAGATKFAYYDTATYAKTLTTDNFGYHNNLIDGCCFIFTGFDNGAVNSTFGLYHSIISVDYICAVYMVYNTRPQADYIQGKM